MLVTHRRLFVVAIAIGLGLGCDKGSSSDAKTSDKSEKTDKDKKTDKSTDKKESDDDKKPTAKADDDDPSTTCPKGTTGPGTADDPCKGKGRVVDGKWTGKWSDHGAVFSVTNHLKRKIDFGWVCVYYYDKAGKLLPFKPEPQMNPTDCYSSSGGVVDLDPNQTTEVSYGFTKEKAPKGTDKVEVEFSKIGWEDKKSADGDSYWENDDLTAQNRPLGGFTP